MDRSQTYGLIAGNGRFPLLALQTAQKLGQPVVVVAIKGEAAKEIETFGYKVHWITIAQLSKLIDILHDERVTQVMMCGQVKHASIFSSLTPDWRLLKLLTSLKEKNTAALIGGVQRVLAEEGITLTDSTVLLKELLAPEGVLTRRKPTREEESDIRYGRRIAQAMATMDIGQSVAISEKACVAVEAMEGTDAMLRRAASLVNGRGLRLVKASSGRAHLLFDVPVAGVGTIDTMIETGTTAMAMDAHRTLLLDREEMVARADEAKLTLVAHAVTEEH